MHHRAVRKGCNKFFTSVKIKATSDAKLNDSPALGQIHELRVLSRCATKVLMRCSQIKLIT